MNPVLPLFLRPGPEQRFALYHAPAGPACRGAVLYVHPFGDEMNKSRRMAALQARRLAGLGYAVLQLDLHGCGDSAGAFEDARWADWKDDVATGCAWLAEQVAAPLTIWGLRLGALLALDYAASASAAPAHLVLWQPVRQGALFLQQWLRLLTANVMLTQGSGSGAAAAARAALVAGETLDVAGYRLTPALADALNALDAATLVPVGASVHWLETAGVAGRALAPDLQRVCAAWRDAGVDLHLHQVPCAPFWASQEITECPALLDATTTIFDGLSHAH